MCYWTTTRILILVCNSGRKVISSQSRKDEMTLYLLCSSGTLILCGNLHKLVHFDDLRFELICLIFIMQIENSVWIWIGEEFVFTLSQIRKRLRLKTVDCCIQAYCYRNSHSWSGCLVDCWFTVRRSVLLPNTIRIVPVERRSTSKPEEGDGERI